jgi:VTC domain
MAEYQDLFERLELKYLIDEPTAEAVRRAILPYCDRDAYNGTCGRGYKIRSLYFDSPSLACFRAKERGDGDRFKLRARVYDARGAVSLEVKRKRGDVVWKARSAVPRDIWAEAAQGWVVPKVKNPRALERFARLFAEIGAEPKIMVDYEREAFASRVDGYARVTFDRNVRYCATLDYDLDMPDQTLLPVPTGVTGDFAAACVLELKCEQFMPGWMAALIHEHQLLRTGFSKYNTAMHDELGWARARDPLLMEIDYA